jgi:hypothetical protein
MTHPVEFILPGLFDPLYKLSFWWIFGYAQYFALLMSCLAINDGWSFFVSFFGGNFKDSYLNGAAMCQGMIRDFW